MRKTTSQLTQQFRNEYAEIFRPSLKQAYYMRIRYFEECGEKQYEGIFHESIDNSAEFFNVPRERIITSRRDLSQAGLVANIGFCYGAKINKRVLVSYPRLLEMVKEGKVSPEIIKRLDKKREKRKKCS